MRVRKDQLAKTQPEKQDRSQLQMWRVMRTGRKPGPTSRGRCTPKLAQDTEADVRTLKQALRKTGSAAGKGGAGESSKGKGAKGRARRAGPDL